MIPRKKRNSSKINLTISVVFHSLLIGGITFFAAREGLLGKKLKQITVTMVPKEKKPEPPKEKAPEPKPVAPTKTAETPPPAAAPPRVQTAATPPPSEAPPAVAPAAVITPDLDFSDGARQVQTTSDPNALYKGLVERALRLRWQRPEDIDDTTYVAEVEVSVDGVGQLGAYRWLRGSNNARWDDSVKAALAHTKSISRPPPKGFPPKFMVRFDVESSRSEEIIQLSSQ